MATPSALSSSKLDIIHAYRRLLRGALQAVQYSSPARFVVRDQVRAAFREAPSSSSSSSARGFDAGVAKRTAWFLEAAARDRGVEHRVVKNLVRVRLARERAVKRWRVVLTEDKHKKLKEQKQGAYDHYDMTVAMLNKSLGIALR